MDRNATIVAVQGMLDHAGFAVSDIIRERTVYFDLVARRDDQILILKILYNIDSLTREIARELRILASSIDGNPMVIGAKSSASRLEDGIVYSRFGIPIMTAVTFTDFATDGVPPLIFSAPGGLYVRLDPRELKRAREEGFSLGRLAEAAGVSRKTIQLYEEGAGALIEAAMRLEDFLGREMILPVDPLRFERTEPREWQDVHDAPELARTILDRLTDIGYHVVPTRGAPFDALSERPQESILTVIDRVDRRLARRAKVISNLSMIVDRDSVIFVENHTIKVSLEGVPLITRDELLNIQDPDRVRDLAEERRKRPRQR